MDEGTLRQLLDDVRSGALHPDDAVARMRHLPFTDLGFARVDHHRELRQGMAEAVYAPGKAPAHAAAIVGELLASGSTAPVILSRAGTDTVQAATDANPGGTVHGDPAGRAGATVVWRPAAARPASDAVVVVTAGTADLPVADEAVAVLGAHGIPVERFTDVGVAGLHRLLDALPSLASARAVDRGRRHGGGPRQPGRRPHTRSGRGRADERRLRRIPRRRHRTARDAGLVRVGAHRGRHRQRLRRGARRRAAPRTGHGDRPDARPAPNGHVVPSEPERPVAAP